MDVFPKRQIFFSSFPSPRKGNNEKKFSIFGLGAKTMDMAQFFAAAAGKHPRLENVGGGGPVTLSVLSPVALREIRLGISGF